MKRPSLTEREREVSSLIVVGLPDKTIADKLHISEETVNFHLRNIYRKMEVHTRLELTIATYLKG